MSLFSLAASQVSVSPGAVIGVLQVLEARSEQRALLDLD